jgi:hypothetical protein
MAVSFLKSGVYSSVAAAENATILRRRLGSIKHATMRQPQYSTEDSSSAVSGAMAPAQAAQQRRRAQGGQACCDETAAVGLGEQQPLCRARGHLCRRYVSADEHRTVRSYTNCDVPVLHLFACAHCSLFAQQHALMMSH